MFLGISGLAIGMCISSLSMLIQQKRFSVAEKLVTVTILVLAGIISGPLWFNAGANYTQFYIACLPLLFYLLPPLVFHYFAIQTQQITLNIKRLYKRHSFPLFCSTVLSLSLWLMPLNEFQPLFFTDEPTLTTWANINAASLAIFIIVWSLSSAGCVFRLLQLRKAHLNNIKNLLSKQQGKNLRWLFLFINFTALLWLYAIIVLIFENRYAAFGISESGIFYLFVMSIWFFTLNAPNQAPPLQDIDIKEVSSYEKSGLDNKRLQRIAAQIEQLIFIEKGYLEPEINASKLAETLGIPTHYLSQTFTQYMQTTFYDYINNARIEAAKLALITTSDTVLKIAYNVGFSTRSSFYNAFKTNTGMTPTAYRKNAKKVKTTGND